MKKKISIRIIIQDGDVAGWAEMQGFTEDDLKLAPEEFAARHLASGFQTARNYLTEYREALQKKQEVAALQGEFHADHIAHGNC
jgi:hypothetical protein